MGNWGIIVPAEATNYIQNPAFRYGTDGWTDYTTSSPTGTRTRGVTYALKGYYSYFIDKTSAASSGDFGVYHDMPDFDDFNAGDIVAASAYLHVEDGVVVRFRIFNTRSGGNDTSFVDYTGPYTGRAETTLTLTADSTNMKVYVYVITTSDAGGFYLSGVQFERTQVTTYFDGDADGCEWAGEWSNSNSIRPIWMRKGGIETSFDDYAFYITGTTGLGAAEIGNDLQEFSNLAGGFINSARTPIRSGALIGELIGTSLADLHNKRVDLFNLFSPDVNGGQEVIIYYDGSGTRLYLDVMLNGGFGSFQRNGFNERLSIQLRALMPYWYLGYQESAALTMTYDSISTYSILAYLDSSGWHQIGNAGATHTVDAILHHQGKVYVGGLFTAVDSVTNSDNFTMWDGTTWNAFGTGVNGRVRAIAIDDLGNIFIGGDFTSCGGVANTAYIAYWDGTAWNDVAGAVINNSVYALAFEPITRRMYIGGAQTDRYYFCLTGDPYTTVTNVGTNPAALVRCLASNSLGDVYFGGDFANIGGDTDLSYVAMYDKSANAHVALGTGANGAVHTVLQHTNGDVYAGGAFTTLSGEAIPRFGVWNGSVWALAGDTGYSCSSGTVMELREDRRGRVIIVGTMVFTHAVVSSLQYGVILDGDNYLDTSISTSSTCVGLDTGGRYDLILMSATGLIQFAGYMDTITNSGTVAIIPNAILVATGDDSLTSGFFLDHLDLLKSIQYVGDLVHYEEIIITNSGNGTTVESSIRGNVVRKIGQSSELSSFKLLPGANRIIGFASHGTPIPDYAGSMYWVPQYWSGDGD